MPAALAWLADRSHRCSAELSVLPYGGLKSEDGPLTGDRTGVEYAVATETMVLSS